MAKLLTRQYGKILFESTKGLKGLELESVIKNFLLFLQSKQMLSKADRIMKEYERYAKEAQGIKMIEIVSARKLTESAIKEISKHFGEKVEATVTIDPKLLGGIMIKTENEILDGSIKGQLEKLKQQL
ncbi:MAG TPA: ATP synthase F1 subunit delta [Candidatus Magasanikbacteria bacterium]|nr:ATP synthase F1 subunit delta [Candidatus Magasanikbacteria bacterium]